MAWQNPNTAANATEERRQKDASNFQKMVQMLGMARQTDGQTMLGFALGKLLRGAYDHYLAKQYEAGRTANVKEPLTGEALQREENFRQYMGIPTMQEYVDRNIGYGGGRTPQERAAINLLPLTGKSASASQHTESVTSPEGTTTAQETSVTPAGGNTYTDMRWATTPGVKTSGKPSALQLYIDANKNFADALDKYGNYRRS